MAVLDRYETLDDYLSYSDDEDLPDPDRATLAAALAAPAPLTNDHISTLASLASDCGGDALFISLPVEHPLIPRTSRAPFAAAHFGIPPGTWQELFGRPKPVVHCGRCAAEGLEPSDDIDPEELHFRNIQIGYHRFLSLFLDG